MASLELLNTQIAADLGTGEQNIKLHRAPIMRKMGVDALPDLVRAAVHSGTGWCPLAQPFLD